MVSNKKEIVGSILKGILIGGAVIIASTSPYFVSRALPEIIRRAKRAYDKNKKRNYSNTFYYLRKRGFIKIENKRGQIYISITKEGRKLAGKYQINELRIKKEKRWDGKWRILIFDIKNKHKVKREALRGKIKQLGLYQLQKSVWVYPYDFTNEMDLLRSFFGINKDEMQIIIAERIENDSKAIKFFKLIQ